MEEDFVSLLSVKRSVGYHEQTLLGGKIPAAKFRNNIKAMQDEQAKVQR